MINHIFENISTFYDSEYFLRSLCIISQKNMHYNIRNNRIVMYAFTNSLTLTHTSPIMQSKLCISLCAGKHGSVISANIMVCNNGVVRIRSRSPGARTIFLNAN